MGFWHILDKIVGYIPVVGTIKDSVEAVVLECQGKHEAAIEKAMEAAVDLVGDAVTVATFGTGYEVAAAGKLAAEVAIKEVEKAGAESVAKAAMREAAKDGFTKTAALAIGAAAAGAHAKEKLKDDIAARKGKRRKQTPRGPNKPATDKPDKDPKRGHHVINNGVRKILPNIIDDFLHQNAHLFHSQGFHDLVEGGHISRRNSVYSAHERPLSATDDQFIQTTTVYTPEGKHHEDTNDAQFGIAMISLRVGVTHYMTNLFNVLVNDPSQISHLDHHFTNMAVSLTEAIHLINTGPMYVDQQALTWWLASPQGNLATYERVRSHVEEMFQSLTHQRAEILTWVRELFHAYQNLY